ncbi:hypothetical protein [Clostridium sp.]|uniref:hypothetical protein n=1 Tax=Clostridium sp. TaxID=1506 RepID=UPI003F3AEEF8
MKITDLALIFLFVVIPFSLTLDLKIDNMKLGEKKRIELNRALDTAVDDGVSQLIEVGGDSKKPIINKEKAIETFYDSLFLNFNALENTTQKGILDSYIPVICVIDRDGYYIYSSEEFEKQGQKVIEKVWQPKQYFTYEADGYIYMFTMDDYLSVYDSNNNRFYEGKRKDLAPVVGTQILSDLETFESTRRKCIVDKVKNDLNYYINNHNTMARQMGIDYMFAIPQIEEEDWYNTVDDIGMMVFFQGYPIGISNEVYNYYAIGGARVYKGAKYYLQNIDGLPYYHRDSCTLLTNRSYEVQTRQEGAKKGYRPCRECMP